MAVGPDMKSFMSFSDAITRLLPYHLFSEPDPLPDFTSCGKAVILC